MYVPPVTRRASTIAQRQAHCVLRSYENTTETAPMRWRDVVHPGATPSSKQTTPAYHNQITILEIAWFPRERKCARADERMRRSSKEQL